MILLRPLAWAFHVLWNLATKTFVWVMANGRQYARSARKRHAEAGLGLTRVCQLGCKDGSEDFLNTVSFMQCFVSNFVAMATRVGRCKIWLTSFDSPTPKTPCETQISQRYLLYKPSYSKFCPKFCCHGNGG